MKILLNMRLDSLYVAGNIGFGAIHVRVHIGGCSIVVLSTEGCFDAH